MALLSDAGVLSLDDLTQYEASIAQILSSHGINLDDKISLAVSVVSDKILVWLLNAGASDPHWSRRRAIGVSDIVLTPALKRWLCFESLARVFAEAYNVQLNTRFGGKLTEYVAEGKRAADLLLLEGIGTVSVPLPRPAMPLISLQSGNVPGQVIVVQVAWADASGNESALSVLNQSVLPDDASIAVAMAEGAIAAPSGAAGWNIYAGAQPSDVTKQNSTLLAVGSTWELPPTGLSIGSKPLGGQRPAVYIPASRQIKRG